MSPNGDYRHDNGYNRTAVFAVIPAALIAAAPVVTPPLNALANFSWFIGMAVGFTIYMALMKRTAPAARPAPAEWPA